MKTTLKRIIAAICSILITGCEISPTFKQIEHMSSKSSDNQITQFLNGSIKAKDSIFDDTAPIYTDTLQPSAFSTSGLSEKLDLRQVTMSVNTARPGKEITISGVPTNAGKIRVLAVNKQSNTSIWCMIRRINSTTIGLIVPLYPEQMDSEFDTDFHVYVRSSVSPSLHFTIKPLETTSRDIRAELPRLGRALRTSELDTESLAVKVVSQLCELPLNSILAMGAASTNQPQFSESDYSISNRVLASSGFFSELDAFIENLPPKELQTYRVQAKTEISADNLVSKIRNRSNFETVYNNNITKITLTAAGTIATIAPMWVPAVAISGLIVTLTLISISVAADAYLGIWPSKLDSIAFTLNNKVAPIGSSIEWSEVLVTASSTGFELDMGVLISITLVKIGAEQLSKTIQSRTFTDWAMNITVNATNSILTAMGWGNLIFKTTHGSWKFPPIGKKTYISDFTYTNYYDSFTTKPIAYVDREERTVHGIEPGTTTLTFNTTIFGNNNDIKDFTDIHFNPLHLETHISPANSESYLGVKTQFTLISKTLSDGSTSSFNPFWKIEENNTGSSIEQSGLYTPGGQPGTDRIGAYIGGKLYSTTIKIKQIPPHAGITIPVKWNGGTPQNPILTIEGTGVVLSAPGSVFWNGNNQQGNPVPYGSYTCTLTASNWAGSSSGTIFVTPNGMTGIDANGKPF